MSGPADEPSEAEIEDVKATANGTREFSPQMRAVARKLAELGEGRPPKGEVSLRDARRFMLEDARFWNADAPPVAAVEAVHLEGPFRAVPGRLYRPETTGTVPPLAIYLHGGGWVKGSPETHDKIARFLALKSGAAVLSLDYALAPEHPFPEPWEEVATVFERLGESARQWGLDGGRLAFAGDSSGANLALAGALEAERRRPGLFRGGALYYGVFDSDLETESYRRFGGGDYPPLARDDMARFWDLYAPRPEDRRDPRAAPLRGTLKGLPPLWLAAAGLDVLRDDSLRLAEKLDAAGVPCELRMFEGVGHSFLHYSRMLDAARAALDAGARALKDFLAA